MIPVPKNGHHAVQRYNWSGHPGRVYPIRLPQRRGLASHCCWFSALLSGLLLPMARCLSVLLVFEGDPLLPAHVSLHDILETRSASIRCSIVEAVLCIALACAIHARSGMVKHTSTMLLFGPSLHCGPIRFEYWEPTRRSLRMCKQIRLVYLLL
jgi:hypothetical protein